jgi:hypothetical protein
MAERAGFEPAVQFLTVRAFSKRLVSATHPPLRRLYVTSIKVKRKQQYTLKFILDAI